ncbi:hypothetical protein Taro_050928 [Colocasia esculenta]|uniref:Uncharacterized protein n=1 Tax=Colocasia esculenta TaxID=4460 RepID=A0A843XFF1_COLES|nr:hypothetical protein [Colocasia esculenta]
MVCTVKVCVVFLDTLTPEFELYIQLRERRQWAATCVCGCAVACSALVVERQLDLSSVAARLRGSLVWFVRVSGWCREPVLVTRVWRALL